MVPDSPSLLSPPYTVSPTMNPISPSKNVYFKLHVSESSNVTYFLLLEKLSKTSVFPSESVNSTTPPHELKSLLLKSKNSTCQEDGHSENRIGGPSSSQIQPESAVDIIAIQRIEVTNLISFPDFPSSCNY